MKESILKGKSILAVDDEADVLDFLEEEVLQVCPNCTIEKPEPSRRAPDYQKQRNGSRRL